MSAGSQKKEEARLAKLDRQLFDALLKNRPAAANAALDKGARADAAYETEIPAPAYWGIEEYDWDSEAEEEVPPTLSDRYGMLRAAARGNCAALVPRLVAAGQAVTLEDINTAVEAGAADALAALLQTVPPGQLPPVPEPDHINWLDSDQACPFLHLIRHAGKLGKRRAPRLAALLVEAGYRPAMFKDTIHCCIEGEFYQLNEARFCPSEAYGMGLTAYAAAGKCSQDNARTLGYTLCDLAGLPKGGQNRWLWDFIQLLIATPAWSQANHRTMPDAFKAVVRTFLLAAHRSPAAGGAGGQAAPGRQGQGLTALPKQVVLHIIELAARPVSAWLE